MACDDAAVIFLPGMHVLLPRVAAATAAMVRIRAFACAAIPGLEDIDLGKYGLKLVAAAFRAFYPFALPIAHRSHDIEYFAAGAFQIIKRHYFNLRKYKICLLITLLYKYARQLTI